jgi:ribosomal protein S18 acetylase RimI-like enzyme
MSRFIIRDYSSSDYKSIDKVWETTGMGGKERNDDEKTIQGSLDIGGRLLILEDSEDGRVIGTSWMTFDGRRIHLHHFGILPDFQGLGLSDELLRESLKHIKKKGYQAKLEVQSSNLKALNIYKKVGFQYLGDYDIYIIRDINNLKIP